MLVFGFCVWLAADCFGGYDGCFAGFCDVWFSLFWIFGYLLTDLFGTLWFSVVLWWAVCFAGLVILLLLWVSRLRPILIVWWCLWTGGLVVRVGLVLGLVLTVLCGWLALAFVLQLGWVLVLDVGFIFGWFLCSFGFDGVFDGCWSLVFDGNLCGCGLDASDVSFCL